jgi:hypothetical protein
LGAVCQSAHAINTSYATQDGSDENFERN